jgi:hypothetical protein
LLCRHKIIKTGQWPHKNTLSFASWRPAKRFYGAFPYIPNYLFIRFGPIAAFFGVFSIGQIEGVNSGTD